jgi:SHS2 domain-containing protein
MGRYRFVEDVALADCAIDLEGEDVDDLFETAARALASVMVDPRTVSMSAHRQVHLEAGALDLLLHDWLSELIFLKDRDREIFPSCRVRVERDGTCRLSAHLSGGRIDPERTALGADPKAVTFHQFTVEQVGGTWRARVVIDI